MELNGFLQSCQSCGAFRGEIAVPGQERTVRVSCRCFQGRCPKCRRALTAMPFNASGDEIAGKVWHAPHIGAHCSACGPLFLAEHEDGLQA